MTDIDLLAAPNNALVNGMTRIEVAPPTLRSWTSGLYAAAHVVTQDARDPWAVVWPDLANTNPAVMQFQCGTAMSAKATTSPDWVYSGAPFVLVAGDECSPVGRTDEEATARAETILAYGEEEAAMAAATTLLATLTPSIDVGKAISDAAAIGLVEAGLRANRASQGVIWLDAATATSAGFALINDNGALSTILGTPVVILPTTTPTAVGSGPVVIYRGSVQTIDGFDRNRNNRVIFAERVLVISVAGPYVHATAPATTTP
jgi:hypothetical protein